jgi:DNA repair protein RecN (Recombination protein N)
VRFGFGGQYFGVRNISEHLLVVPRKEEPVCLDFAVNHRKWRHEEIAEGKWPRNSVRGDLQIPTIAILPIKNVGKGRFETIEALAVRENWKFFVLPHRETAEIVESHDVIAVGVGEQGSIQMANAFAEALLPEVRSGIDDKTDFRCRNEKGGAKSLVFRIFREADFAVTPDHRDPDGSSRAEEDDFCFCLHCKRRRRVRYCEPFSNTHVMLSVLKIKNLALVDDLTWELGSGLIGVTGQTGAGKSMIVGALKLILGERANHDLIRTGESICSVEAIFELTSNLDQVNALLESSGLEPCEGNSLVVKRSFGTGNKQFVNCSPCTLSVLKSIGGYLVDLHGPHEHQSLLSQDRQLAMLDAYAHAGPERRAYRQAFAVLMTALEALEDFRSLRQVSDQEIELLRFQVEEIAATALNSAEAAELELRYRQSQNGSRLVENANQAVDLLSAASANLANAQRCIRELERFDPSIADRVAGFDSARVEIEELEGNLREYSEALEIDPTELALVERRIDEIETLKRKYGQTVEDVIAYEAKARQRLDSVDGREAELLRLNAGVEAATADVNRAGKVLTEKREKSAPSLAKEIAAHLDDLGFNQSIFEIEIEPLLAPGPKGLEGIDFLFGPNPGEPLKPLRVIASSGEMSRVMLAVKSALADQDQIPLMVFDEIDANVGGEIAGAVGRKMAFLGDRHQVVAITHMPQVAALAHRHYLVIKEVENDTTNSRLESVSGKSRVNELARMLGGVSPETLALAERMMKDQTRKK